MRDKPRGGGFWVASIWIEVGLVVDAMHSISSSAIVLLAETNRKVGNESESFDKPL